MKIVIIGGSGLIGSKVATRLGALGHEVLTASPATGVNTITGEGLAEALKGASVVIDVANSPSFEENAVMEFFTTSGRNLLAAEAVAGVKHHIALSVVGTDRLKDSAYFRAKMAQENLVRDSGIPYTIVHSTQFFEFAGSIAQSGNQGKAVHLPAALVQPIAADDVAAAVADVSLGTPLNSIIEIAGPKRLGMDEWIRRYLSVTGDPRQVVTDVEALYFGAKPDDKSLVPGEGARIGAIGFDEWIIADTLRKKNM
ncbi:SDR family oxidoreductase [Chitinophaga barathri]|uniref:SDR family oxidoreductase n=1 Tax=Chitinophaga barathri TaxID=1647451 RepID=A0A3N4ME10_9BACT|nr:SDR family oxidoreductase [Chitinophaga barathri]RPD38330.1 SDR family oxidoreductase [Chitinophaga barathri]